MPNGLRPRLRPLLVTGLVLLVTGTASADHPRLLFSAADLPALRARAGAWPWSTMHEQVRACTTHTYTPDASVYSQYKSMTRVMQTAALACVLFPEQRRRYVDHIVAQFEHWDDLNALRRTRPVSDWASMIDGGDAFFSSVLALDVIHDDLSDATRTALEGRLQTWFEYERDVATGNWVLAKYGALGLWALYREDAEAFETYARAYDERLRRHFTDDGVFLAGGSYASARLAGGELAKTHFMDVLTYQGWYDYYGDPLLGAFYEWFYAGMLTPIRHYAIFQDTRETRHSGTWRTIANWRVTRFTGNAAAHAAWLEPPPPQSGLLAYVLIDEQLPEPVSPASRLWMSGYAALWEAPHERAVMAALWSPNRLFEHDHYEVNAIHLTGYGKTLLRNTGYEGWGNPASGFSWHYVSAFDLRDEWDDAVGGNIAYLQKNPPHRSKAGAGLQEGLLHPVVDYAAGDAGDAVKAGHHLRSVVLVKDRTGGAVPYVLLFDEMQRRRAEKSDPSAPLRLALHPASLVHETLQEDVSYRWHFGDDVHLTLFLATPASEATRLKRGGLSQFDEAPWYLHAEFPFDGDAIHTLTALVPHEGETAPALERIEADGFSGLIVRHTPDLRDIALATDPSGSAAVDGIALEGVGAWVRQARGEATACFARQTRRLDAGDCGFTADAPVSVVRADSTARIVSPGTQVSFRTTATTVMLDGIAVPSRRVDGSLRVRVPAGTHELIFRE